MGTFDARLLAQRLVGGMGVAAFDEEIRERRAMRFEAALDADACDRPLSQFVAEALRQFAAQSQVNVYLTPPRKSGCPPHFDTTDVVVVSPATLFQAACRDGKPRSRQA